MTTFVGVCSDFVAVYSEVLGREPRGLKPAPWGGLSARLKLFPFAERLESSFFASCRVEPFYKTGRREWVTTLMLGVLWYPTHDGESVIDGHL